MGVWDILHDAGRRTCRLVTTFDGRKITVPESPLSEYPAEDKPLVIQLNSLKTIIGTRAQIHVRSAYDGVVINSNGVNSNTGPESVLDGAVLTSEIFLLSPQKMGLDPKVLRASMRQESSKKNDYMFFSNNCVDHVIRPMQKAGSRINLGLISTPRDLSEFCEDAVRKGMGIRISPEEYRKALKSKNTIIHQATLLQVKSASEKMQSKR